MLHWMSKTISVENPNPKLCIDADCPNCKYPERYYEIATGLFGCNNCQHKSKTRTN